MAFHVEVGNKVENEFEWSGMFMGGIVENWHWKTSCIKTTEGCGCLTKSLKFYWNYFPGRLIWQGI